MRLKKISSVVIRKIYSHLPVQGISRPVFIIGCGRSGTTIFGTILSKHPQITYLNEPRHLWTLAYPETDIWSQSSFARKGKLFFDKSDIDHKKSNHLRRLFQLETIINRRPKLVEKLPINTFRLQFISEIFPDALFIHIYRNGLEVARSIEKISSNGAWFGSGSYKWDRLSEYVTNHAERKDILNLCSTYFDKGLLEWRFSTEAAVKFLESLPQDRFFEFSYSQLIETPQSIIPQVLELIGLERDIAIDEFIATHVSRRSQNLGHEKLSDKELAIGGDLLPLSMASERKLTQTKN